MTTTVEPQQAKPSHARLPYAKRLAGALVAFFGLYLLLSVMRYLQAPPIVQIGAMFIGMAGLLVYWLVIGFRRTRHIGNFGFLKWTWVFLGLVLLPNLHALGFVVSTVFLLLMPGGTERQQVRLKREKMKQIRIARS